mgnify:CR=1 FL=1
MRTRGKDKIRVFIAQVRFLLMFYGQNQTTFDVVFTCVNNDFEMILLKVCVTISVLHLGRSQG